MKLHDFTLAQTFCASVVASAILIGCTQNNSLPQNGQKIGPSPTYEFSYFGRISNDELYFKLTEPRLAVGDFDGDGDQDIVVSSRYGYIYLLENKIPQKNTNNLESALERR